MVTALIATASSPPQSVRNRLPDERRSITHKFQVGSHEGYLVVGLYPDGSQERFSLRWPKRARPYQV